MLSHSCTVQCFSGKTKEDEDVPLVEFMYFAFTHMPGEVTVGDSCLCCCVCVMSFEC